MARNFYDGTDAELYTGSQHAVEVLGPDPTLYGVTEPQLASFAGFNGVYMTTYLAAINPDTRTQGRVAAKNAARANLRREAMKLAALVRAHPSITAEMLIDLGLHVRKQRAPVPPPSVAPGTRILSVDGRRVTLGVFDPTSATMRRRLAGVVTAWGYSFVGEDYPSDPTQWDFQGALDRNELAVTFPETTPAGARVWLCATWVTRTGATGPISLPLSTNLQVGGVSMRPELKMAA